MVYLRYARAMATSLLSKGVGEIVMSAEKHVVSSTGGIDNPN